MSLYATISPDKLWRRIGRPDAPALIDVRTDEDFAADPLLVPGAGRRPAADVAAWAGGFAGRAVVAICQHGHTLSHGVAAWLRQAGAAAEVLEGGVDAWAAAGLPRVPAARIPPRDGQGRTVWVTRARPKIDRIACPWLIRRFVDPEAVFLFVPPAGGGRRRRAVRGDAVRHRRPGRVLDASRRALHLRRHGGGVRPGGRGAAGAPGADRARRRYRAARSRAGGGGAAGGLARAVAHVCRRPGAARGGARALRRLLALVPRRHRRDAQLAGRAARRRAA